MAEYKQEDCPFVYRIEAVTKIVDGDTVDCVFDLGFDVMFKSRVRLLGIDTPESRTRHKNEKVYGLLSKKNLKKWVHWAIDSDRDDVEIELRCPEADSRGKFGRILGEHGHAVGYWGQNKDDVKGEHWKNREYLAETGEQELLQWDDN